MKLDEKDRAILSALQRDATQTLQSLSKELAVSKSTLWRRIKDYETAGIIKGRVALLDPRLVGLKLCIVATVKLKSHGEEAVRAFQSLVETRPEIVECYAVAGAYDYMLKIRVGDVEDYEAFLAHILLRNPAVGSVSSGLALREVKYTTALPL